MIDDAEGYREKWRRLADDSSDRDPEAVAAAALRDFTALCRSLPGGDGVTLYTLDGEAIDGAHVPQPPMMRRSATRCRAIGNNRKRCRFPTTGTAFCKHHDALNDRLDVDPAP